MAQLPGRCRVSGKEDRLYRASTAVHQGVQVKNAYLILISFAASWGLLAINLANHNGPAGPTGIVFDEYGISLPLGSKCWETTLGAGV
jgi:hypothetical protein